VAGAPPRTRLEEFTALSWSGPISWIRRRGRKGMEGKEEPLQTKSLATALPRISFLSYCLQE